MENFKYEEKINPNTDSISAYLTEISRYPLLSEEEEKQLFNKVKVGDKKAKDLFIKCNLRIVVSISKKYIDKGMEFLDIIQEGNLGLMKAVDMFNVDMNYKFSTYATYWIEKYIQYAFAQKSKIIRFPKQVYNLIKKYKAIEERLEKELYRKPTIEEIASEMEITVVCAKKIYNCTLDPISLEKQFTEEDYTLESVIPSNINIEEDYINKDRLIQLKEILLKADLGQENLEMLILRYTTNISLRDLGKMYNLGHQSISYRIEQSMKKIRKINNINHLKTYI